MQNTFTKFRLKSGLFLLTFFYISYSQARVIVLNVENNNSSGNLYTQNENYQLGDVIRFTNNLQTQISNVQPQYSMISDQNNAQTPVSLAPGQYTEVALNQTNITDFMFIHMNMSQNLYLNNKIVLTYTPSTAALLEQQDPFSMFCFPNPSQGMIWFSANDLTQGLKVEIYSEKGNLMKVADVTPIERSISLEDLDAGIYFLKCINRSEEQVIKIIKQ